MEATNMAPMNNSESSTEESISSPSDVARRADVGLRDTLQTYLKKFGVNIDLEEIEKRIRDNPMPSAAIAAASGFVIGGGIATRPALAILDLFGRKAVTATAANFMTGIVRKHTR
jgi:ElaB/YqjD/DUF883 family membrane-anchored ribosome-binding protein